MTMNGNLSQQQINTSPSFDKAGAMPLRPKYDGPPPIKEDNQESDMNPNKSMRLAKPGFF